MDGLTHPEAAQRLKKYGANRLQPLKHRAVLWQFIAQFRNPLVLMAAIGVSAAARFRANSDPLYGGDTAQDFKALFSRIDN